MLSALAAGPRTDLEILLLQGSRIEVGADHLVVRSPHNPDFHWGNYVHVTTGDPDDAGRWLEVFARAFPQAGHVALGLPRRPHPEAYAAHGLEVGTDDVLTTTELPEQRPLAEGYAVRALLPDDWAQVRRAAADENARTGDYDPREHDAFTVAQIASRRRLAAAGSAAFFGAFTDDGLLAADLGIVALGRRARYQSVGTVAEHRRRGLAGHLLGVAARWAAERGAREWVIVTESTNDAGRLYRSVGFRDDVQVVAAYRKPDRET